MDKWTRAVLASLFVWLTATRMLAAEGPTNPPPASVSTNIAPTNAAPTNVTATAAPSPDPAVMKAHQESLRSYLRLQEQLHATMLAVQQSRLEASVEAQTNVTAMMSRLETLEKELAEQRAAQVKSAQESNRTLIYAAGGIFLVGVLAMVITSILQARGMNRLAEIAVESRMGATGIPESWPLALANGAGHGGNRWLLENGEGSPGADGSRLQSTIRQLETRIREIEVTSDPAPPPPTREQNGHADPPGAPLRAVVLARIQTLFNLGQPQAALTALDDAIAREPNEAEWHLRKGIALERLKRFEPALQAFDRAIALDGRCTQAYLSKGGVLNQQARYQEALACYERALEQQSATTKASS